MLPSRHRMQEMSFGNEHQLRGASLSRESLGVDSVLFTRPVHIFIHKYLLDHYHVAGIVLDTEDGQ